MGNKTLSIPGVSVNNLPIGIVPNSLKYTLGKGVTNVRAASTGGGGSTSVHSEDAEEQVGKIKWEMFPTPEELALIRLWKDNTGANVIAATQSGITPLSGTFMSMVNDPEVEATADGKFPVEFEGDPLSNN